MGFTTFVFVVVILLILSRYTSGLMVYLRALSIHNHLFTASKNHNQAFAASPIVKGQYG